MRILSSIGALALVLAASACGPTALPAFANPPPYDAGLGLDAAHAGDDAGPSR